MFDIKREKKSGKIYYITSNSGFNKELKIDLPLNKSLAREIFQSVIDNYEKIEDQKIDQKILNCKIKFVEKDNYYLIIIADMKNKFPEDDDCDQKFKTQN